MLFNGWEIKSSVYVDWIVFVSTAVQRILDAERSLVETWL